MRDSIVILSFNKLSVTRKCVAAAVCGTRFSGPAELVVVDNGSTDGSAEWIRGELAALCAEHGLSFKPILNTANAGCSTARNQALAAATGDLVTFLDNDVEPATPDWLNALRARMDAEPDTGMVGGLLLYPPRPGRPDTIQCAGVGVSHTGHVCFVGRGEQFGAAYAEAREVQCLISACMMIRRDLYLKYGGFDEIFNPVQFEDFDLCYKFRENGWRAWYEPLARMYHHESTTTAGSPSIRNAAVVVRNGLKFQRKWRHMFSCENGPSDDECRWRKIDFGQLPVSRN